MTESNKDSFKQLLSWKEDFCWTQAGSDKVFVTQITIDESKREAILVWETGDKQTIPFGVATGVKEDISSPIKFSYVSLAELLALA